MREIHVSHELRYGASDSEHRANTMIKISVTATCPISYGSTNTMAPAPAKIEGDNFGAFSKTKKFYEKIMSLLQMEHRHRLHTHD